MKKLLFLLLILPAFASSQTFDQDLYYGIQESNGVKELQEFLTDNSFYNGSITGNFFSLTLAGVKKFQAANSITPLSGYFGPKSRGKANEILVQAGISKNQIVTENGTTASVSSTPAKTTNDVINSLTEQIKLLQQQLVLLQQQQTTLQQQNQQISQQTQTLQKIQQQTAPQQNPPSQPTAIPDAPTEISIQGSICNLIQTNLKTEYQLYDLLQNGNINGRIFMDAYILNQHGQNYYNNNPTAVMTIITSDHLNDKTLNGSGSAGPCGFHYSYQFYATQAGTYTITYSVPTFNISKTITLNIKLPEKPIIGSTGITVSTSEKETDFPTSEINNVNTTSNIKYWFQSFKPNYQYSISAWCSDGDTSFSKIDVVSHLEKDGLYYYRGYFLKGNQFSGITTCKFIHSANSSMTIFSESDPVMFETR